MKLAVVMFLTAFLCSICFLCVQSVSASEKIMRSDSVSKNIEIGMTNMGTEKKIDIHDDMKQGSCVKKFQDSDPEFTELFDNFALDEVAGSCDLDEKTKYMAILASLIGCSGIDVFQELLPAALDAGVTPAEAKEIIYQSTAYLGIGRISGFLTATNEIFQARGIHQPLENRSTTSVDSRREAGTQAQVDIFGDNMKNFWKSGPEETRHINYWLAANCFGDYYTRKGLNYKQREMITFCFLFAQGGCEPQLTSHAGANIRIGNDRIFLIKVVSQCLPYIGYPRSLNAIRCINDANKIIEDKKSSTFAASAMPLTDKKQAQADKSGDLSVFGLGTPLPEVLSKYFTGRAYLKSLTSEGVQMSNVTFEPRCRNNWHIHHKGGQILLVTGGRGYYQAWGEEAQELKAGDVVNIPPEVKHWHGAAKDSWFCHIAIAVPAEGASNEWLEPVSDEIYNQLK